MAAPAQPRWYLKLPPPFWALTMLLIAYGLERSYPWAALIYARSLTNAVVIGLAGLALAAWSIGAFAAVGTEIAPASIANKKLVTDGPFRFTRNPMYLSLVLAMVGVAFYQGTLPFFAVPVLVFLICHLVFIPFEEAKMQRQHGNPYKDYLHRVRRWI
jgi:protein-S-isoprenylcysteine O-methyltransferase Ste14